MAAAAALPQIPVPQPVTSLGPLPISSSDWTVVSRGPKQPAGSPPTLGAPNPFKSLSYPKGPLDFSDSDCTPSPNPLMGKLKVIDEMEGRELKTKARGGLELGQSSKKKSKGGGVANPKILLKF